MDTDDPFSPALGVLVGGIGPIAAAATLVPVRGEINHANVGLVLVVVVVAAAYLGGRGAGALAAASSALSFDFFHTQPYLRLTIDAADDVETTILLLVVGLAVGQIASSARARKAAIAAGQSEIARIHRVAEMVANGAEAATVLFAAQEELMALLDLSRCRFEAPPDERQLARLERSGVVVGLTHWRLAKAGGFELPEGGVELEVLARGHPVGRFVLEPTPGVGVPLERRVVAVAIADQVGGAIGSSGSLAVNLERNEHDG
ncbi:MAG: DUF4118 domain-containing protein [Acidimicrobiales bacterium]